MKEVYAVIRVFLQDKPNEVCVPLPLGDSEDYRQGVVIDIYMCQTCAGTGGMLCTRCSGSGVECPQCGGSGVEVCYDCSGSGLNVRTQRAEEN